MKKNSLKTKKNIVKMKIKFMVKMKKKKNFTKTRIKFKKFCRKYL